MNRMDRIEAAKNTLKVLMAGYYIVENKLVDVSKAHKKSIDDSYLVKPEKLKELVNKSKNNKDINNCKIEVLNTSTVKAINDAIKKGKKNIGVLNFASARNPGGGFLNGASAQEESLARVSGLYATQLINQDYYIINRKNQSMMYTDYMIYSKDVVFIKDENLKLMKDPITVDIISAPAVNYGQVVIKGEDIEMAKKVMKNRMRKILALFASEQNKHIILGAYGCGVFKNDPKLIAKYFNELLYEENYVAYFESIIFAIYDKTDNKECLGPFEEEFNYKLF